MDLTLNLTEQSVSEFWKRQGATTTDNFTVLATSSDNITFYQVGKQLQCSYH